MNKQKGYGSALFVLGTSRSGDGIGKGDEEGFLFEPVVGGPCPKGLKLLYAPKGRTELTPESIEGPTLGTLPPEIPWTTCNTYSGECLHGGTIQISNFHPASLPARCAVSPPQSTSCVSCGGSRVRLIYGLRIFFGHCLLLGQLYSNHCLAGNPTLAFYPNLSHLC